MAFRIHDLTPQAGKAILHTVMRFAITHDPLSVDALSRLVLADAGERGEGSGAVASFLGVVRATHQGRRVRHLDYEAFEPLALTVFGRIDQEVAEQWPGAVLAMHHRIGRLAVGEASIAIAVATAHRDAACRACRYAIERVKQVAPVWKHEFFDDGDAWVEGAVADLNDARARQEALRLACA